MAIFVDSAGLNTLVSSSFDDTNTITSGRNTEIATIPIEEELVGINIHRNGHYGYSTWKQLRVSENPITRHHRETNKMTFVVQPGPVHITSYTTETTELDQSGDPVPVQLNGELRVRDRYSALHNFTEPAITQKSYPLVWNVGRHLKDSDGNVDFENPQRFSIISSYGNQQIAFANDEVSKLHKFDPDEERTEYVVIKDMYLENGLNKQDSPLTHWEFLQYRESVFPKSVRQYVSQTRTRPNFQSFYRHNPLDRIRVLNVAPDNTPGEAFDYPNDAAVLGRVSQSTWPLDPGKHFLTASYTKTFPYNIGLFRGDIDNREEGGAGILVSPLAEFNVSRSARVALLNGTVDPINAQSRANQINTRNAPYPIYSRRPTSSRIHAFSNPSGLLITGTGSIPDEVQNPSVPTGEIFNGTALWEAGDKRQIKNADGTYTFAPKQPFYDTYENYVEDVRKFGKNYSIIPEFRMSAQIEDYKSTDGGVEIDMFEVTGGITGIEDSSKSDFYEIYSNTDFMKNFEVIADDHKDFTNGKVLSLRCKVIKKFLPYKGFYPCQRTVDISERFYESFKDNIKVYTSEGIELNDFNFGKSMVMTPLFRPGVLFNTIKSGIAVDYPVITGSGLQTTSSGMLQQAFDRRIPFEALLTPKTYLADYKLTSNEPNPQGNLSASAIWDGEGDELYSMMSNNFIAESINFFLPNGQLSSVVSKKQKDIKIFEDGQVYAMRLKMRRSMDKARPSVYHSSSTGGNAVNFPYFPPQDIIKTGSFAVRENFTMYSRPSAFGPPSRGISTWLGSNNVLRGFNQARDELTNAMPNSQLILDSTNGFNFPFTPPYYHGEAWCDMWLTGSGEELTIKQIQSRVTASFTRFDSTFINTGSNPTDPQGPQSLFNNRINTQAVQLSSSMNIFGIGTVSTKRRAGTAGSLVVDSGVEIENRWVMQTKFETPMLNFNHIQQSSSHLTLPITGSGSVPRGMWHQYGRIPEENKGVFVQVGPIPKNYQTQVMNREEETNDLSEHLGFSGVGTKLGRLAQRKEISEAVVAVPFIKEEGKRRFFKIDKNKVDIYKAGPENENYASLTSGPPEAQIGRSVLNQMEKMKKYIFPPSFDFMNFDTDRVVPIAMYIFEFSHTLSQADLQDIWQNLPPDIGTEMEVAEVAITHPLLKKELLGQGGEGGNTSIDISNKLKWMVFKVKQRAASNYFKKTVLANPDVNVDVESGNVTKDEFGQTSTIQYNWPYDFFSLVEMVKIDSEIEMGNFDEDELKNYIDNIPSWNAVQADRDKIEYIVGGLEDEPIPEVAVPDYKGPKRTSLGFFSPPDKEGIADAPDNIPPADGNVYKLLKIRFTIEANQNPLDNVGNLQGIALSALLNLGYPILNLSSVTEQSFRAWTQDWYNTDSRFQQKRQEAQAGADSAEALMSERNLIQFEGEVLNFIKTKYNQYDTAFRGKAAAKEKAYDEMIAEYSGDSRYTPDLQLRAYDSIDIGSASGGVTLE